MATAVYFLCAVTSALLLWSSLSFSLFALSNALVFTDFVILPELDLSLYRAATACGAIALLVYGLVWDAES